MAAPVVENFNVVQRAGVSFLVDVLGEVFVTPAELSGINFTLEWGLDVAGPFSPATAQPYDRKHTLTGNAILPPIPVASPGVAFDYVWAPLFDLPEGDGIQVYLRLTVEADTTGDDQTYVYGPFSINTLQEVDEKTPFQSSIDRRAAVARTPLDFLGNGLVNPFRRGERDFNSARGAELIRSSVRQILGTRAAVRNFAGELQWRPDFGQKFWILRHRNNDSALATILEAYMQDALEWEPRVMVTGVDVKQPPETDDSTVQVRVLYTIIEENVEDNRVNIPTYQEVVDLSF